ncbi:N-acetylmuramoyl-L-alanine amidase [Nonomuraea phyllanthi]|uniref:N-acetylmuramoyl-L-alanine amidase n=1 Tax=Nonomuraea phyllanthi TaxID=2219224 RepID=UPI001D1474F9|nr:N-acetylmuramoyl-L-alanine amidase [Nonomuraea phyllanthi]
MRLWLTATLIAGTLTTPAHAQAAGPSGRQADSTAASGGPGRPALGGSERRAGVAAAHRHPAHPGEPGRQAGSAGPGESGRQSGSAAVSGESGRQADFAAAAREYGVPVSVLLGVSYLESRWDFNGGSPSTAGGYGPMHLVDAFPADAMGSLIGDALGDARGDDSRPLPGTAAMAPAPSAARLAAPPVTLPEAGRLIGADLALVRSDPATNIRAGAALLASYQRRPSADPADWYEAVARYSGSEDEAAAHGFADEVFAVMREGVERRTDDGFLVRLDPVAGLPSPASGAPGLPGPTSGAPDLPGPASGAADLPGPASGASSLPEPASAADLPESASGEDTESTTQFDPDPSPLEDETDTDADYPDYTDYMDYSNDPDFPDYPDHWRDPEEEQPRQNVEKTGDGGHVECPASLACEWMPAPHRRFGKKHHRDYGNHDHLSRARTVDYIIIHDTEGGYQGIPSLIRNPKYVSWHYTIRSRDGHVAQHVRTNDIAWHAGNWDFNTRSIGIEHEGYLAKAGTWYTEAMYRSSARLVRYLAHKYDIPLDRAHILGHDNVPGTTPKTVAGMHDDPGPYWDWEHYFELLNRPLKGAKNGDSIMIRPSYDKNRPRFTGCVSRKPGKACPRHGASTVWLHKQPSESAPLVDDPGKHPGRPSTYSVYDHGARASTGQRYAVADRQGDWTAIWYLGQKAWFHNPPANPTAVPARGPLITPRRPGTRVYGRAYPERSAYKLASYQPLIPLQYKIGPGQQYAVGDTVTGSYYAAGAFSPSRHVTTTGRLRYYQIQLGHRVMFVMAKDVRLIR